MYIKYVTIFVVIPLVKYSSPLYNDFFMFDNSCILEIKLMVRCCWLVDKQIVVMNKRTQAFFADVSRRFLAVHLGFTYS